MDDLFIEFREIGNQMKYTQIDVNRMKEAVRNLRARLAEELQKTPRDMNQIRKIENEINGYENSISGKYN